METGCRKFWHSSDYRGHACQGRGLEWKWSGKDVETNHRRRLPLRHIELRPNPIKATLCDIPPVALSPLLASTNSRNSYHWESFCDNVPVRVPGCLVFKRARLPPYCHHRFPSISLGLPLFLFNSRPPLNVNMSSEKKDPEGLAPVASQPGQAGQVYDTQAYSHDAVFGEITEDGPNYRSVRDNFSSFHFFNFLSFNFLSSYSFYFLFFFFQLNHLDRKTLTLLSWDGWAPPPS